MEKKRSKRCTTSLRLESGFTLIEMILVVALLSAFAITLLTVLNPLAQFQKSNDARRKSDLYQIQRALETYYQDYGQYPPSVVSNNIYYIKNVNTNGPILWGKSWQPYMNILPQDPSSSKSYVYYSPPSSNGQTYYLYASLDRGGKDLQACNSGNACSSLSTNGIPATACGDTCNFGLSSPNVSP